MSEILKKFRNYPNFAVESQTTELKWIIIKLVALTMVIVIKGLKLLFFCSLTARLKLVASIQTSVSITLVNLTSESSSNDCSFVYRVSFNAESTKCFGTSSEISVNCKLVDFVSDFADG